MMMSRAFCAGAALLAAIGGCAPDDRCGPQTARVVRVVDGDTLDLDDGDRVRILGIDAPETGPAPECGGLEAFRSLAAAAEGRRVTLAYGPTCRDRHGRLLAHVRVGGVLAGQQLLAAGLACPCFPEPGDDHQQQFLEAAQVARARGLGLWGACAPIPCP